MKKTILAILTLFAFSMQGQEITIFTGSNYTEYSFQNPAPTAENFSAEGMGSYIEIGYRKKLGKKTKKSISYNLGFNLNEYNANTGNLANFYSWKTSYFGVRNGITIPVLYVGNGLEFDLELGATINAIVHGQQNINGMIYDIRKHEEFYGLTGWLDYGFAVKYNFNKNIKLAVGYSLSENYQLSSEDLWHNIYNPNGTEEIENVKFDNRRLKLGLILKLNN